MNNKEFPSDATREAFEIVQDHMVSKQSGVQNHWTVLRTDLDMTYGGLHEEEADAENARKAIIAKAKAGYGPGKEAQADEAAKVWERNTRIIFLLSDQDFPPHGTFRKIHTHGATDGTHGSKVKPLSDKVFF